METTTLNILIIAGATIVSIAVVAASVAFIVVGKEAFRASSPSAAGAFGLLFLALPSVCTIVLIVLATATLTGVGILKAEGCIAIFSSVASFVLGAETQKRRNTTKKSDDSNKKLGE